MAQPSLLLRPRKNVNYAHHISLTSSDDDSDNAAEGGEAKPARPKKSYVQDDGMETSEKAKSKAMVLQAVLKNVDNAQDIGQFAGHTEQVGWNFWSLEFHL